MLKIVNRPLIPENAQLENSVLINNSAKSRVWGHWYRPCNYRAFSILELLVTVVIIAILMTVAIPIYKNYIIQAKFTELINAAEPYKLETAKAFYTTGLAPANRTDTLNTALITTAGFWQYTTTIEVIHMKPQNFYPEWTANDALLFWGTLENGSVVWKCYRHPHAEIPAKYLPVACQALAPF